MRGIRDCGSIPGSDTGPFEYIQTNGKGAIVVAPLNCSSFCFSTQVLKLKRFKIKILIAVEGGRKGPSV